MELEQRNEARKKLENLTKLIEERTKELSQLRKEKKATEALIESLNESLGTYSFNEEQKYPWDRQVKDCLVNVFKLKQFRNLQETVINCTLSGKDCIYVAATGSGKSLVFQLPALVSTGITLVISPLLSLMEDQVTQMERLGIPAMVLNASTTKKDFNHVASSMIDPNATLKLVYVTPEKLAKSKFIMSQIERMYEAGRFSRLVIDEVHCCSEWGHDFRKDYNALHIFKRQFPDTPILGLTATATPQVILDIKKMLNIPRCLVFKSSFYRPNLVYEIRSTTKKDNLLDIIDLITNRFYKQSGIIYCLTIKDTEEVASKLTSLGVDCLAYHAQLDNNLRSEIQRDWYNNRCNVIAATVAFGLGINKMDVRFVIHYSISKSLENYYQETGRAGRDGNPAYCICYYRFADVFRATSLTFRERNGKERVYKMLSFCLNRTDCRKKLIAQHFQDELKKDKTDKECCDNCKYNTSGRYDTVDGSDWLENMLEILSQASRQNEKMTSNKLIEAWMQVKGPKKLRLEGITKPSLNRTDCETVLGLLLCQGYFQENFHITPYNTISYIIPGSQSMMRRQQNNTIPIYKACLESFNIMGDCKQGTSNETNNSVNCNGNNNNNNYDSNDRRNQPKLKLEQDVEIIDFTDFEEETKKGWSKVECFTID